MQTKWENVIDSVLGIKGAHINSALVSAQNRRRIYWSNIKTTRYGLFNHDLYTHIPRPADRCIYLRDILEDEVDKKYFISDNMHDWLVSRSKKKNVKIRIMSGDDKSHCITATAIYKGNLDTDYVPVTIMVKEGLGDILLWNVLVCKLFLIGINGIVQTPKSTRCLATDGL